MAVKFDSNALARRNSLTIASLSRMRVFRAMDAQSKIKLITRIPISTLTVDEQKVKD